MRGFQRRRHLGFHAVLMLLGVCGMAGVWSLKIAPLSEPASPPPPGVELAWAGQQLRGYSETAYVSAGECSGRTRILLDLYSTGIAPPAAFTPVRAPGRIAFAVAGDASLPPNGVRVWRVDAGSDLLRRLLDGDRRELPSPVDVDSEERFERGTARRTSIAFDFSWNPKSDPRLIVELDTDWLSSRTGDDSCWLRVPALVETIDARTAANGALGRDDWASSYLGQPLYNASVYVNSWLPGPLRVEPATSIPAPSDIDPASWSCGGWRFAADNCQAAAVLEEPGRASARTRELALWSALGGLLLALVGAGLIGVLRTLVLGESAPD